MAKIYQNLQIIHKAKIRGAYLVLAPFVLMAIMGLAGLVVDLGMMRVAASELQTAVDAAALAAAEGTNTSNSYAITAANNIINGTFFVGNLQAQNVSVTLGNWDTKTGTFTANNAGPSAVQVTASVHPPLFFMKLFTSNNYTITKTSIASLIGGPRDILFVVDLSPYMSQYSQFSSYPSQDLTTIKNNLLSIYNALNVPTLGNLKWDPVTVTGSTNTILETLGLKTVNYPYPGGSWNDYINYIKNDSSISAAGYQNQYGYLTFVNYLLSQQPGYSQTPGLWKTPEKPLDTVKSDITDYIANSLSTDDRVGLIVYNYTGGNTAFVEQSLTFSTSNVSSILNGNTGTNTPGRQAGHYSSNSDMMSGISAAVSEFNNNGRSNAQWIVFLMTSQTLTNNGISAIVNQINKSNNYDITLNTITFGANGNINLVQQITTISGQNATTVLPGSSSQSLAQIANASGQAEIVQ